MPPTASASSSRPSRMPASISSPRPASRSRPGCWKCRPWNGVSCCSPSPWSGSAKRSTPHSSSPSILPRPSITRSPEKPRTPPLARFCWRRAWQQSSARSSFFPGWHSCSAKPHRPEGGAPTRHSTTARRSGATPRFSCRCEYQDIALPKLAHLFSQAYRPEGGAPTRHSTATIFVPSQAGTPVQLNASPRGRGSYSHSAAAIFVPMRISAQKAVGPLCDTLDPIHRVSNQRQGKTQKMAARDTLLTQRAMRLLAAAILLASHVMPAIAGPLAASGDTRLRHDLQLLSDHGLLSAPLTTWPLSWSDISASLKTDDEERLLPHLRSALQRVETRLEKVLDGRLQTRIEVGGNSDPELLRSFADTQRSKGEISVSGRGSNDRLAYQLKATAAVESEDGRDARLDGSYASLLLGSWTVSAAMVDRWWGPGWDGSLILSNNARPVPSLVLQRNRSTPFGTPLLKWLGPWQFTTFMGQLESGRAVPDALLFGVRFNFRPAEGLEIGISRTAQWCGDGRQCDLGTLGDLLGGNDNVDAQLTHNEEPGNQLGELDFRWAIKQLGAVYAQVIGEDEAGGLPSKPFGLAGIETWGAWQNAGASWRTFLEVADTRTGRLSDHTYNTTYNHGIYQSGYRYRGKSLGPGADNDSTILTLGLLLSDRREHGWQLTGRSAEFNRDDGGLNPFSPRHQKYRSLELRHPRPFYSGQITADVGVHHTRLVAEGTSDTDPRLALAWQSGW